MPDLTQPWTSVEPKLSQSTIDCLQKKGFTLMTPVQASTIPHFLKHKDVVVEAITGSGKTLAFLVPLLEILKRRERPLLPNQIASIIIAPTRELATQIYAVLEDLLTADKGSAFTLELFVGFEKKESDFARLKRAQGGANIVVGTPGRLVDILCQKDVPLDMREFEVLVLDEADRLLDLGFAGAMQTLFGRVPKQRRTALFSATMSDEVNGLVKAGLRNPIRIIVKVENKDTKESQRIPSTLTIQYTIQRAEDKLAHLQRFLADKQDLKIIIFFATCNSTNYFAKVFESFDVLKSFKAFTLHRKVDTKRRQKIYKEFSETKSALLLCTDIAARGLDIDDIDLVIQFDAPQDPKAFIHRCGRTARLGSQGRALLYLLPNEEAYLEFLKIRKVPMEPLPELEPPSAALAAQADALTAMRAINGADEQMFRKSIQAFVSYIRFYQEHQAKFIFNLKNLDIADIAKLFGLFKIPVMPELRGRVIDFPAASCNFNVKFRPLPSADGPKIDGKKSGKDKRKRPAGRPRPSASHKKSK